ncbi:MAG: alpha-isopropylmalate synthase regulatory domain-containing protein, partial [SAR324 cluster bacterium]|nr:alpha-isopropylmalate synthase regulatory domain-containing protein [SAR324 cluster bacterium]
METRPKIILMDTTLRDGEQTQGMSFTPAEKTNLAKALLNKLKVDRIEIASARVSSGEMEGVQRITSWAEEKGYLEQIEVLGFVDHTLSVDWILEAGGRVMNLLTKGSENHCTNQLRKTLDEHLREIRKTMAYARQRNVRVNVYLEDWSNGYRDKPEYVYEMLQGLKDEGIERIMLPDTLGVMSPDQVFDSMTDMQNRYPWASFDFHPHNDYGLGVANAMYAVKAGIRSIHCTMNCLGERAGNASLAEVAVVLKDQLDAELSIEEANLTPVAEMVENFSGKRLARNSPIVGEDVFTQTSGIHADGDKKGGLYHNPIFPERFGRNRSYALGKMSGKASLNKNLELLGIQLIDENLQKVLRRVVELGDSKKTITLADLPFIITDVLETHEEQRIQLLNCSISSGLNLNSVASIRILFDKREHNESGSGNGGYDAFMSSIKKILKKHHLQCPELL